MKIKQEKINNYNDLLYIKQILIIIFKYHTNEKTIMFLGTPNEVLGKYRKKVFKTKHIFISNNYWVKGLLTNKAAFTRGLIKKKSNNLKNFHLQKYLMKKRKPNLLIIFSHKNKSEVLREASNLKIPVISFVEGKTSEYVLYPIILSEMENRIKYNNLIFYLLNPLLVKNYKLPVRKSYKIRKVSRKKYRNVNYRHTRYKHSNYQRVQKPVVRNAVGQNHPSHKISNKNLRKVDSKKPPLRKPQFDLTKK